MADIVKVFYEIGEIYKDEKVNDFNDIFANKIDKFVEFDIDTSVYRIVDRDVIAHRLITVSTSSKGGYLLPNLPLMDKNGLKAVWSNMEKNFSPNKSRSVIQKNALDTIKSKIDYQKIEQIKNEISKEESVKKSKEQNIYYLVLKCRGRYISERFRSVYFHYLNSAFGKSTKKAQSYLNSATHSGADAGLNFCSLNELPTSLEKLTKWRLLPLDEESAKKVAHGFKRVFEKEEFRYRLFGLTYYLLPTVFLKDKKRFFAEMARTAIEDNNDLISKEILEKRLERLVERLEEVDISQKVLFTFLFAEVNKASYKLYQTIEDVAPSRIAKAARSMEKFSIDSSNLSKYIKKTEHKKTHIYIRDYIAEPLLLAKLIFGKEHIYDQDMLYKIINQKIMFGNNQADNENREFSKILNGYYGDDTDFEKHQRFLDFLEDIDALGCNTRNLINGGKMNDTSSFKALMEEKFANVELLKSSRAREFYVVGALARFVISWQYTKDSDTVAKYIDSIGSINTQNIDRVFRKIYDGSRKYSMHGEEFDSLIGAYSQIKSQIKQSDNLSIDKANIAFVMGNIDYKNFKSTSKEESEK